MSLTKQALSQTFWSLEKDEVLRLLETSADGVSDNEALSRLTIFGRNLINANRATAKLEIFLRQFMSPLIIVLMVVGAITLFLKDYKDSIFIFIAVFVNAALGFYQENKAESALSGLRSYIKERVRVLRGGAEREIDAEEVVPGDIVRLFPGMRVPADARLIAVNNLALDESILTGESLPNADKTVEPVSKSSTIVDQDSMIFAGTLVNEGLGYAVVARTGSASELGRIASLVAGQKEEKTPLQKAIASFTLKSSLGLAGLTVIVFLVGIYLEYELLPMFIISVAVGVSAVPEGLPIALTVILAIGVERLAKKKGIVRKLLAAETLGSTTLILTDKTGTLTEAKMKLAKIYGPKSEEEIISLALLNTEVIVENPEADPSDWRIIGHPLEIALVKAAAERKIFIKKLRQDYKVIDKEPFNSTNKFASVSVMKGNEKITVYLGAPDILIKKINLSPDEEYEIAQQVDSLAFSGHRVLGVFLEKSFAGLLAFRDPIRKGVGQAIKEVFEAGVRTVIMTGDHKGTALSVANECGIESKLSEVLSGEDIRNMSDEDLFGKLDTIKIFARVLPEDKARIAGLYKKKGEIVAMTGDGVNDAPALKSADIGIAVGSGTDVAKGAADLVILDDNFETIVVAIEEGRRTLSNAKKVITYTFSNTFDTLVLIGGCLVIGLELPINPAQILWINFFLDSFPGVALGFEDGRGYLREKPLAKGVSLLDPMMRFFIFVIGVLSSFGLLLMYGALVGFGFESGLVKTFMFTSLSLYTLFFIFSVKNLKASILTYNPFSNRYLNLAVIAGFFFTFIAIYFPPLQSVLGTTPLPPAWLAGVVVFGLFNVLLVEFGKWLFRRTKKGGLL